MGRAGLGLGLASLLLVSACGSLPQPFFGQPGAIARRLSQPPPSRLAVAPPSEALLPEAAGVAWAGAVADALVAQEIPAVPSGRATGRDWRLVLAAEQRDGMVVPSYAVLDPAGVRQGVSEGQPIALQAWADADPATLRLAAADAAPGVTSPRSRAIYGVLGIGGACLFFGDGAITPAISVLSAVEGLQTVYPGFKPWVQRASG